LRSNMWTGLVGACQDPKAREPASGGHEVPEPVLELAGSRRGHPGCLLQAKVGGLAGADDSDAAQVPL
jgi:hypothetical protein